MDKSTFLASEKKFSHEIAKLYMSGLDTSNMSVEDFYKTFKQARNDILSMVRQESGWTEW